MQIAFSDYRNKVNALYGRVVAVMSAVDFEEISISADDYNKLEYFRGKLKVIQDDLVFCGKRMITVSDVDWKIISDAEIMTSKLNC